MFPFKTDTFSFSTKSEEEEVKIKIEKLIAKERFLELRSSRRLYGRVKENSAVYTLGEFPNKNAFIPIVVLEWKSCNEYTEVSGYYRLDFRILFGLFILPMSGAIISFQIGNPMPLLFLLVAGIALLTIFHFFYKKSKEGIISINTDEVLRKLKS